MGRGVGGVGEREKRRVGCVGGGGRGWCGGGGGQIFLRLVSPTLSRSPFQRSAQKLLLLIAASSPAGCDEEKRTGEHLSSLSQEPRAQIQATMDPDPHAEGAQAGRINDKPPRTCSPRKTLGPRHRLGFRGSESLSPIKRSFETKKGRQKTGET